MLFGRSSLAGAAALLLAASTLAVPGVAAQSNAPVTLNYWAFSGGVTSKTAAKVLEDFKASHPNVTVNATVLDTLDFDVTLPTVFDTSAGPDILYTGTEPNHLGRYVNVNQVLPLDEYWTKYGWDKLPAATQARLSYNGHPYAVGNELETIGIFYNKKIFDKLGIPVPSFDMTLEQFETDVLAAIKAKDPSITPMFLACGGPCYSGLHMMHTFGYSTIPTTTILATTPNDTGAYTDPAWLAMLQRFDTWTKAGYFSQGANGIPDENHLADLCSGRAAMAVEGPWFFQAASDCEKANPDVFEFGFAPFPAAKGLPFQEYVGTGKAWAFPESLKNDPAKLQAALDLVGALTSPDAAVSYVQQDQKFPAVPYERTKVTLTAPQEMALKIMDTAGVNGGAVDIGFNNSAEETKVWINGLQGILGGTATPDQVVASLQQQLTKDQADWKAATGS